MDASLPHDFDAGLPIRSVSSFQYDEEGLLAKALGVSYAAYRVLAELWRADGIETSDLALSLRSGSVRAPVDELVLCGLVERIPMPDGACKVWLTNDGHRTSVLAQHSRMAPHAAQTRYFWTNLPAPTA